MTISNVSLINQSGASTTFVFTPATIGDLLVLTTYAVGSDYDCVSYIDATYGGGSSIYAPQNINVGYSKIGSLFGVTMEAAQWTWIAETTSPVTFTLNLNSFNLPTVRGISCSEYSTSTSGGTWSWPGYSAGSSPQMVYIRQNNIAGVILSSGNYNTYANYPQTPGLTGLSGKDNLFIAGGYFNSGGAGPSTGGGFTYSNFGSPTSRCQFIYQTNVTSSSTYMPSWSQSVAGYFTTCATIISYTAPAGNPIVMIV